MMRLVIAIMACLVAGCASTKPKCKPELSKACDETQLEYWEDMMFAETEK